MSLSDHTLPLPHIIDSKLVFEKSLIKIREDLLQLSNAPPYHYFTLLTKPSSVVVIATTPEGKYLLNSEYRHPIGKVILCFPGGYIDEGEDPLEASKRELIEETGYQAEDFKLIGSAYPYPGITGQKVYYVHAINATFSCPIQPEASEIFEVKLLDDSQIDQALQQGTEIDANLCTAFFFLQRNWG